MFKKKITTEQLVVMAIMVALHIILTRFLSINLWNMRIGFSFIPLFFTGYLYGPISAAGVGLVADILGANLFPTGPFFPGFTLNAILVGLIMGFFFYKKQDIKRIIGAVAVDQLIISLWITPIWLSILFGSEYEALVLSRLPQIGVMLVVEPVTLYFFIKLMKNTNVKSTLDSTNSKEREDIFD